MKLILLVTGVNDRGGFPDTDGLLGRYDSQVRNLGHSWAGEVRGTKLKMRACGKV